MRDKGLQGDVESLREAADLTEATMKRRGGFRSPASASAWADVVQAIKVMERLAYLEDTRDE